MPAIGFVTRPMADRFTRLSGMFASNRDHLANHLDRQGLGLDLIPGS